MEITELTIRLTFFQQGKIEGSAAPLTLRYRVADDFTLAGPEDGAYRFADAEGVIHLFNWNTILEVTLRKRIEPDLPPPKGANGKEEQK